MSAIRDTVQQWIDDAAALGDVDSYEAKRTNKRFACGWDMEMKTGPATHRVTVRDVSQNGIGIMSPVEIGAGRTIEIRRNEDEPWIPARVMHATLTVGRYKLGATIEFDGITARKREGDDTPRIAESYIALAKLKLNRGDASAAEMLVRECCETRRNALPEGHWLTAEAESFLGECLVILRRFSGAEPLLTASFEAIKDSLGDDDDRTKAARQRVIELYEAWEQPEKADAYRTPLE